MSRFTLVVTANAFRESAPASEQLVMDAGGAVRYPPCMGPLPATDLIAALRDADAVVAASDPYTGAVLDACPRLKVIARWGTGYDAVDVQACTDRGVVACNAPGLNVEAVADFVIGTMLALARRLPHQIAVMRSGGWEEVRGVELFGKTIGMVGFGAIGKAVTRRARGFECRVLAYDPFLSSEAMLASGAEPADLRRLFREANFVTLHAALTPESRSLIGEELLRSMKPDAYFINAARGPLVVEQALVSALTEGWIAGAAVDAYSEEPLRPDHPLRHLPNCLATPHSAFNTVEVADATNRAVVDQVIAVLRGEMPRNCLNPAVFESAAFRGRDSLL